MKKSLLALAVFGAFAGTAAAQVTVYGQLEVGYGSRTATNAAGIDTTETSGVQGDILGASRFGVRGSEDLGNGLKGVFALETGVDTTGVTTPFNGAARLAYVGLQGGFGTITIGRDNNPIHSVAAASDVDGRNRFSSTGQLYDGTNRANAITYTSPSMGGFTARAQISNQSNETRDGTTGVRTADTTDRTVSLAAAYANGPMTLGVGFENQDGETTLNDRKTWIVGGAYDLKVVKLFANAQRRTVDRGTVGGTVAGQKNSEYNFGVTAPIGAFTLVGSVGRNKQERPGVADVDGTDYNVGANYSLSKRTFAYARVARYDTFNRAENTGYQIGVRHAF